MSKSQETLQIPLPKGWNKTLDRDTHTYSQSPSFPGQAGSQSPS